MVDLRVHARCQQVCLYTLGGCLLTSVPLQKLRKLWQAAGEALPYRPNTTVPSFLSLSFGFTSCMEHLRQYSQGEYVHML